MKHALSLCSLALNPGSPQPTASMVKIENGAMWAYGGTFCIRVPVQIEVGCCFNPKTVLTFFRKERKAFSCTIQKGKLILADGKEKLTTRCLPPEEMVTLDVLDKPVKCGLDMDNLKLAASVVDPSHATLSATGINFRQGGIEASNNKLLVFGESGLPEEMEFNLPLDSAKALLRIKSPVVSVAKDQRAVKFVCKDGTSLTSLLVCEMLPDLSRLFEGRWTDCGLTEPLARDLLTIECESVIFRDGRIRYIQENGEGELNSSVERSISFQIRKSYMDVAIQCGLDWKIHEAGNILQAVGENRCVISALMSLDR